MSIEAAQFRIIPDPQDRSKWAYENLLHDRLDKIVGGFRTAKDARRAFERTRKSKQSDTGAGK